MRISKIEFGKNITIKIYGLISMMLNVKIVLKKSQILYLLDI